MRDAFTSKGVILESKEAGEVVRIGLQRDSIPSSGEPRPVNTNFV